VSLSKIPRNVINATIAVEDDQFYYHHGFDLKSMIRAAKATFLDDELQGGSTITQQLVKNVLLTPERTVSRKLKELFLSMIVETRFTKNQIMEMYLNNISYGGTAWGIQSAAQKFFNKNVWELDLAEASLLAGLPSAPSAYSPLTGDIGVAKQRQQYVLQRMVQLGYISRAEALAAYDKELTFAPQTEYIRAPHFVAYVLKDLEERYGNRYVEQGGLTVRTTLDLDLQEKVQRIVAEGVERYAYLSIGNGAAVVLDARDAEILAYVGSVDYFKEDWGAFDVASAYRQPGSSIKPVTYSLALENGMTPASIIRDRPVTFRIPGQKPYTPKNYDGKYHGNVTLRQALANSYNVPAVRLANLLGPDNIVALGRQFGLKNWQVDGSYGLAVTLGGKEVRLLDHTNLYATFARYGVYKDTTPYLSIKDRQGFEIYQDVREENQVVKAETAYIIWHILSDEQARLPAFGTNNFLTIPGKTLAAKTGTTDQIRDNFTMGFTPSYAVGVWVGNNDNSPLNQSLASGLSGAAPIWNEITTVVLENSGDEKMKKPEGVFVKYDEDCAKSEIFVKGSKVPDHLCRINDDDSDNSDKD
jgi:1A family penicillin-binding protein